MNTLEDNYKEKPAHFISRLNYLNRRNLYNLLR